MPKSAKLIECTGGSKRIKVTWKRVKGIDGYQIQYSKNKNFSKKKIVTVKGSKSLSKTIKKLSAGTTYYVRVRTYKSVNKKKYYSKWSNVMSAKTHTVTERTKAMQAYSKLLVPEDYQHESFALYDFNDDGMPEMIRLGGGNSDYTSIFTYKDGKTKNIFYCSGITLYSNGLLKSTLTSGFGYWMVSYYTVDSNLRFNYKYRYALRTDEEYPGSWYQGEYAYDKDRSELVDKSVIEYNESQLLLGSQEINITYYKNTAANRSKYLK